MWVNKVQLRALTDLPAWVLLQEQAVGSQIHNLLPQITYWRHDLVFNLPPEVLTCLSCFKQRTGLQIWPHRGPVAVSSRWWKRIGRVTFLTLYSGNFVKPFCIRCPSMVSKGKTWRSEITAPQILVVFFFLKEKTLRTVILISMLQCFWPVKLLQVAMEVTFVWCLL